MNRTILYLLLIFPFLSACHQKVVKQGMITYAIEYQLPDSLNRYLIYLPKSAVIYFKGDSAVSIQQANDESTTIITYKPTDFMRVLLTSSVKKYVIDYNKDDQVEESPAKSGYTYAAGTETKIIAGHKALKYTLTNKATGEISEGWFTKDISVIPNSLTMAFDTAYGLPLDFTLNQNGMVVKTTVKQVKFEPAPAGVFSIPAGYEPLTPKQLREMPVEN